ncbi:MAG TPA: carboxypeptidase-like regulatory domain-containing protein [Acidimicrobiales bacterium]|nr:carboxypeptidase-like regulatory domain-containing protein [Acidimicrobiales bacterium]
MRLEVNPTELDATVGEPIVLQVEAYNSRSVIDGYRATLLGLPRQSFTSDPPELSLFPETRGVMLLTFTLPPTFPAGSRVIGVKVASVIDPSESAAREVRLNVAPVEVTTLTAEPLAVAAGKEATYSLTMTNQGNVPVEARLRASDSLGKLAFRLSPATLVLGPGESAVSRVIAAGGRPLFGSPLPHQLTFTAEGTAQPLQTATTFMQKPLIPRGILTLLSILAALAIWGAVLFIGANKVGDEVREANAADDKAVGAPFSGLPGGGGVLASVAGKVTAAPDAMDATVSLIPVPSEGGGGPPGEVPAPVTTPPTGEFKIENVAAPGVYQIVFAKVGLGSQSRLIEVKLGDMLTGVDVTLVAGSASVSGSVTDAGGPVGAATITAVNGTDTITTVTAPTGPVGTFSLSGLPAPATYAISVTKKGFGTETRVVDVVADQQVTGFDIVLSEGTGSVSGTVFDKTGLPLADVLVSVRAGAGTVPTSVAPPPSLAQGPVRESDLTPDVLGAAVTLADGPVGFFSIGGLPTPGTYTVTFQKEGYLPATATASLAEDGNETSLSPLLQPVTGVVRGVVGQDIARVVPCAPLACRLPEAQVTVTDRNGSEVRNTTTASNPADRLGAYEVAGLQAGAYTITFSKTGYIPQTFSVTLVDGEPERVLDVQLRGVMVALSGSAPNCTGVEVVLRNGRPFGPPAVASVRPDGEYRIPRVYTPGEYAVVFRVGGTVLGSVPLELGPGETGVEVDGFCPPPTTMGIIDSIFGTTTTLGPPS